MYPEDPNQIQAPPQSNAVFADNQAYPPVNPEPVQPEPIVELNPQQAPVYFDPVSQLNAQLQMINIADGMSEDELRKIGSKVVDDFEIDKDSRSSWEKDYKEIKKVALLAVEKKTWAGKIVSNVKYPLVMTASIHFSSRAYPEIVKGREICKGVVVGKDPTGEKSKAAQRLSDHMSYQLLEEMDWELELDQLLTSLPILGCMFKKTYRCGLEERNISELVFPEKLVVNYWCKDLETAARVTHIIELSHNEIVERINAGVFIDLDVDKLGPPDPNSISEENDAPDSGNDDDAPYIFLEQHRWYDLDKDGYQEPYIVTVHHKSQKVVRITARYDLDGIKTNEKKEIVRIKPVNYFTRFIFMNSPDGCFYGLGFGKLMFGINQTVNTILNQLIDAGTASNRQSGFISKQLKLGGSDGYQLAIGEWRTVASSGDDIRKNIIPIPTKEPSQVLFTLLQFLVEAGKELSSVSDVMSGESPAANVPAASTLAVIEQGLKVFSGIFKRLYRSLKDEFKKIARLNRMYKPENYNIILDDPSANIEADYSDTSLDVVPVADPTNASDMMRSLKAEALLKMLGQGLNDNEIKKRYLLSLGIENVETIMPQENAPPPTDPKVDAEVGLLQAKAEREKVNAGLIAEKTNSERVKQEVQRAGVVLDDKKLKIETARTISDIKTAEKNSKIGAVTAIAKVKQSSLKGKSVNKSEQGGFIDKQLKSDNNPQ
jgi:chaperonin GroES